MDTPSFFEDLHKKGENLVLQILFQERLSSLIVASLLQTIPCFFPNCAAERPSFANTYKKLFVSRKDCIANHGNKTWFEPKCRYHPIVTGGIGKLLHDLDATCFIYQHVDCLYTLIKYFLCRSFSFEIRQLFHKVQTAVQYNQRLSGVDRMPTVAKKALDKKTEGWKLSSIQMTNSNKTNRSMFAEKSELAKWLNLIRNQKKLNVVFWRVMANMIVF